MRITSSFFSSLATLVISIFKAEYLSIQWQSKHYDEIKEEPGLIVIDEAHLALAKTYDFRKRF